MKTFLLAALAICLHAVVFAQEPSPAAPQAPESKGTPAEGALPASAKWLLGEWIFDEEHTQKKQAGAKEAGGPADALAKGLVNPQLIEQLKGAKLKITDTEVIMTTQNGNGKAERYTYLDAPDENTVSLKGSDGKVTAYHREGDYLWIDSTGTAPSPFYFRKAK